MHVYPNPGQAYTVMLLSSLHYTARVIIQIMLTSVGVYGRSFTREEEEDNEPPHGRQCFTREEEEKNRRRSAVK